MVYVLYMITFCWLKALSQFQFEIISCLTAYFKVKTIKTATTLQNDSGILDSLECHKLCSEQQNQWKCFAKLKNGTKLHFSCFHSQNKNNCILSCTINKPDRICSFLSNYLVALHRIEHIQNTRMCFKYGEPTSDDYTVYLCGYAQHKMSK